MFDWLARLVDRRGRWIVLAWLVFALALYATAPEWRLVTKDDDVSFFPVHFPSVIGQELFKRGFPDEISNSAVVVVAERAGESFRQDDFAAVDQVSRSLNGLKENPKLGVRKILDRNVLGIGARLIKAKPGVGQIALTVVELKGTYVSRQARDAVDAIEKILDEQKVPAGLKLGMTGAAVVGHDTNRASTRSVQDTTNATIVLVIVILLVVYRSPLLALIPMATIALSVVTSLWAIALLTKLPFLNFQVINITDVFVIVVLFGAGTDYCLFLIARYREELARGRRGREALSHAIRQVGGALVASAGTVILGLGMLWFSTFAKIQYTGPAIALSLAIGLVGSLTLAPVLLNLLQKVVFWPFRAPHHVQGADPELESLQETPLFGFWTRVSDVVVRYPGRILGVSLAILAPLAIVGARTQASYDLLADLGPDQPAILGAEMLKKYYEFGEIGPSTVLIRDESLDFLTPKGEAAIAEFSRRLAALPNVIEVRSLSQYLGVPEAPANPNKPEPANLFRGLGVSSKDLFRRLARPQIEAFYVSTRAKPEDRNHITRFDVIFKTSPFSLASLESLDRVRAEVARATEPGGPFAGAGPQDLGFAGTTVLVNDLKRVTTDDQRRMYVLVTLGVYGILVALLRRPGICLYLIVTVILGYLASLGLTELVFRSLHHGPDPWSGLDWKVGFFLFVILVAVGEDYNIFLMARVIEEEHKHGAVEGTRRAVAHTGGIISSCGVIMAGTFGSMLFGSLTTLRELGFALGLGVLLDTFIVRPVLVPAFVVLLHRSQPGDKITAPLIASSEDSAAPTAAEVAG